jgi:hypothetical protein
VRDYLRELRHLWREERSLVVFALLSGAFVLFTLYEVWTIVAAPDELDPMLWTGAAFFLVGAFLAADSRRRLIAAIDRMRDDAVLIPANTQRKAALVARLEARAASARRLHAVVVAVANLLVVSLGLVLVPWLVHGEPLLRGAGTGLLPEALGVADPLLFVALLAIVFAAGAIAGMRLGEIAAYGGLGEVIREPGIELALRLQPHHPDGVGGAAPLRDYLLRQAALALLPPVWLAVWFALTSASGLAERYDIWRFPFLLLFLLALFYAWQALLRPLHATQQQVEQAIARLPPADAVAMRRRWFLSPARAQAILQGLCLLIIAALPLKFAADARLADLGLKDRLVAAIFGQP